MTGQEDFDDLDDDFLACQPHRPVVSLEDDISGEALEWECVDCGRPCNPWGDEW